MRAFAIRQDEAISVTPPDGAFVGRVSVVNIKNYSSKVRVGFSFPNSVGVLRSEINGTVHAKPKKADWRDHWLSIGRNLYESVNLYLDQVPIGSVTLLGISWRKGIASIGIDLPEGWKLEVGAKVLQTPAESA